jgi:hypothetical protein
MDPCRVGFPSVKFPAKPLGNFTFEIPKLFLVLAVDRDGIRVNWIRRFSGQVQRLVK